MVNLNLLVGSEDMVFGGACAHTICAHARKLGAEADNFCETRLDALSGSHSLLRGDIPTYATSLRGAEKRSRDPRALRERSSWGPIPND